MTLSQETVVWYDDGSSPNGLDSGTVVPAFGFVDAHSVEVTTDGCSHPVVLRYGRGTGRVVSGAGSRVGPGRVTAVGGGR